MGSRAVVLNYVITDRHGVILDASDAAADMLDIRPRHLRGRSLLIFFDKDRTEWAAALKAASTGLVVEQDGSLRPRDRRSIKVGVELSRAMNSASDDALVWSFFRQPTQSGR